MMLLGLSQSKRRTSRRQAGNRHDGYGTKDLNLPYEVTDESSYANQEKHRKSNNPAKLNKEMEARVLLEVVATTLSEGTNPATYPLRGYLTTPLDEINGLEHTELLQDLGALAVKISSQSTTINMFYEMLQQKGMKMMRVDLPLQVNDADWALIRRMAPIVALFRANLKKARLPDNVIRTVRRLFTVAIEENFKALFSAETCDRLHHFFSIINASLLKMKYSEFMSHVQPEGSLKEAIAILDSLREDDEEIIPDLEQLGKWQ